MAWWSVITVSIPSVDASDTSSSEPTPQSTVTITDAPASWSRVTAPALSPWPSSTRSGMYGIDRRPSPANASTSRAVPASPSTSKSPNTATGSPSRFALMSLSTARAMSGSRIGSWNCAASGARYLASSPRSRMPRPWTRWARNGGSPIDWEYPAGGAGSSRHALSRCSVTP